MRRARLAVGLLAAVAAGVVLSVLLWGRPADPLDALMTRLLRETGLPGVVVATGLPGGAPVLRAWGRADRGEARLLDTSDRFRLASLSKPVTAAAVLALVAQGRLDLDDRLAAVLPEVTGAADPRMADVTLRHLLSHRGGWDRAQAGDPFFAGPAQLVRMVGEGPARAAVGQADCAPLADAMLARPLEFAPGAAYAYSNLGYCWLGRVLAARTGGSYAQAVHALVPEAVDLTLAPGALTVAPWVPEALLAPPGMVPGVIAAAGGWIGDAAAFHRFALRPVDAAALERPVETGSHGEAIQFYGLGWRVWTLEGRTVLTHFGTMPGAFSVVIRRPDGPAFTALFSGRPADDLAAFGAVLSGVLALPQWRAARP
jgi:N-acyl-D-amino-acid deacylase